MIFAEFDDDSTYVHYAMAASSISNDPMTFAAAMDSPIAHEWRGAMLREIESIEITETWVEVVIPEGANVVGCKWVFKTKCDAKGMIIKYKARIVAKGYSQVHGVDFDETFSPVARLTSLRILLVIVAYYDLELHQMDADTAFLNGILEETIYMEFPEGYTPKSKKATGLRLKKALYGLKQASRCWWTMVTEYLSELGFTRLQSDWGLYVRYDNNSPTFVLVYVDDILIASRTVGEIEAVKAALKAEWKWTDAGEAGYILGFKIQRNRSEKLLNLSQTAYIDNIIDKFQLTDANSVSTPLVHGQTLDVSPNSINPERQSLYRAMVGCVMWLAIASRPDVAYAASLLGQFNANPNDEHLTTAKRVLRYLKGTSTTFLQLGKHNDELLAGWCDSDYAGDIVTRRSTGGYVFKVYGSTVSWASTRQRTVALSTCEAEYQSLTEAAKEATYLKQFFDEIKTDAGQIVLHCDNQGAIALANKPSHHRRIKHVDVRTHYVREVVQRGIVQIHYIPTHEQVADVLTKGLPGPIHAKHVEGLGLMK